VKISPNSERLCVFLFQAASSVYKELAFNTQDIDVNYLQAWVSNWQMVFCVVLLPLNSLSMLGPQVQNSLLLQSFLFSAYAFLQSVPWNELWAAVVNGFYCNLGVDSVVLPNCLKQATARTYPSLFLLWIFIAGVCGISFNSLDCRHATM